MRCIARCSEAATPDAVSRKGGERERQRHGDKETKSGDTIQFAVHSHVTAPSACMNDEEIAKQKKISKCTLYKAIFNEKY